MGHLIIRLKASQSLRAVLALPDSISTKEILPITLRVGDGDAQPGDQPEQVSVWAIIQRVKIDGQHLTQQVSVGSSVELAEGTGPILPTSIPFSLQANCRRNDQGNLPS